MKLLPLLFFAVTYFSSHAWAMDFESSQIEIVSAVEGTGQLEVVEAGIKITLPDGWYTYWRMPGDSGLAPRFHWKDTKNIKQTDIHWPLPKRFETAGLHSFGYGYGGDVYLPIAFHLTERGKAISGDLTMEMMICKEICIPETHEVSFTVPEGPAERSQYAAPLNDARDSMPSIGDTPRLKLNTAVLGKDSIVVTAVSRDGFENTDVIIEVEDNFMNTPPEVIMGDDQTRAVLKVTAPEHVDDLTKELFGEKITVTLINNGEAVEKDFQF